MKHWKVAFHLRGLECSVKNFGLRAWTITTSNKSLQSSPTRYRIPLFLGNWTGKYLGIVKLKLGLDLDLDSHKVKGAVRDQEEFLIGIRQTFKEPSHIRGRFYVVLHVVADNPMHDRVRWANRVLMRKINMANEKMFNKASLWGILICALHEALRLLYNNRIGIC